MSRKLKPAGERRAPGRRCVVRGCARPTGPGTIICPVHADALRPVVPVTFSHPEPEGPDAA